MTTCIKCGLGFSAEETKMGYLVSLSIGSTPYRFHLHCANDIMVEWIDFNILQAPMPETKLK